MKRFNLFITLTLIIAFFWTASIPILIKIFGPPDSLSAAGDMFGGVSSLFSGLALAGVIFAIWLQSEDIKLNQESLNKTMESNKISLQIMALSSLIQECDSALLRYERWENQSKNSDYIAAKKKVRDKLKIHREELESVLKTINQKNKEQ